MKIATGLSWYTPTGVLLRKCNWLSVRQLITYHTALTVHKTVVSGYPQNIKDKMSTETYHSTRQQVKFSQNFTGKSERTKGTFCYRGAMLYNRLPMELLTSTSLDMFKNKLKIWVKNNIPVD